MVKEYIRKQEIVQALRWTGTNEDELRKFTEYDRNRPWSSDGSGFLQFHYSERTVWLPVGSYIVRDIHGRFFPYTKGEFEDSFITAEENYEFLKTYLLSSSTMAIILEEDHNKLLDKLNEIRDNKYFSPLHWDIEGRPSEYIITKAGYDFILNNLKGDINE